MATIKHPVHGSNSGYSLNECAAGGLRVIQSVTSYVTNHAAATVIRLCKIPAGHAVVDATLFADAIDDVADLVLDIGVEDTIQDPTDTTNVDAFFDGTTLGQAGGIARMTLKTGFVAAVDYDRWVTATVMTDAATLTTGGELGIILTTRPEQTSEVAIAPDAV